MIWISSCILVTTSMKPPIFPCRTDTRRGYWACVEPLHECKTLQDYECVITNTDAIRCSSDARIPANHRNGGMIMNSPMEPGGAGDVHNEEQDGPWSERLKVCFRVRWEWLPIRHPDPKDIQRVYRTVKLGGLADIFHDQHSHLSRSTCTAARDV